MATNTNKSQQLLLWFAVVLTITTLSFSSSSSSEAYPSGYGSCEDAGGDLIPPRREVYGEGRILDITHRYTTNTPYGFYESGIGQFIWLLGSMKNGSIANFSVMKLPTHAGTHVDAPGHMFDHYYDAGFDVDTLDLEVLNGPALLVDVPRDKNITAEVMKSLHIPKGVRRVLFRTLNTDRQLMLKREFDTSYVGFMKDGAQWLVDNTDIKLVAMLLLSTWYSRLYSILHGTSMDVSYWFPKNSPSIKLELITYLSLHMMI